MGIRESIRGWAGNPSLAQVAIATGITLGCLAILLVIIGSVTDEVSVPLAVAIVLAAAVLN